MSKFVDEIIKDIKTNPCEWFSKDSGCIFNKSVSLDCCFNTRFLSVMILKVNGKIMRTSYSDRWRLEVVVGWWFKNSTLAMNKAKL